MSNTTRLPKRGDVVFLADGFHFVYVEHPSVGDDDGLFEISADDATDYIVIRAPERDDELRAAVHDDGKRVAWRVAEVG